VSGFLGGFLDVTVHADNCVATRSKTDLASAYHDAVARSSTNTIPMELGGTTIGMPSDAYSGQLDVLGRRRCGGIGACVLPRSCQ
jgi:hypothetical protein